MNNLLNGLTISDASGGLQNPALRDIVRKAERKYVHNDMIRTIDYTRQFDSDVKRTEYRNCVVRWETGRLIWLNPLLLLLLRSI